MLVGINGAALIRKKHTPQGLPKLPEALLAALAVPRPDVFLQINEFVTLAPNGALLNDWPDTLFSVYGAFAVRAHCDTCDAVFDFAILDDRRRTCRPSFVPGKTKAFLGYINMDTGEVYGGMVMFPEWGSK